MCQVSSASTNPMVMATTLRTEPRTVAVVSSLATRYMTIMTTSPCGMWWIMIGTVAAVHARVRRTVAPSRPGVGASSRRRNSTRGEEFPRSGRDGAGPLMGSTLRPGSSAFLADGHHGRGAQPEGLVRVLDLEAHREPRGQAHPVDRLLDAREAHHARPVLRKDGPAEADHGAPEVPARLRL